MNRGHLHGHPSCMVESLRYQFIHLKQLLFTHCGTALTVGALAGLQAFCAFQGCAWLLLLTGKLLDGGGLDSFICAWTIHIDEIPYFCSAHPDGGRGPSTGTVECSGRFGVTALVWVTT
ncbi:hypothetical protein BDR03DRAFT_938024 [Suillus americanus]|nr:hypothetical protein BDR03DRAFT_938024 [Suillus americanus]